MVGGEPIDTGTTNVLLFVFHQPWNVLLFFFINEYKNVVAHF